MGCSSSVGRLLGAVYVLFVGCLELLGGSYFWFAIQNSNYIDLFVSINGSKVSKKIQNLCRLHHKIHHQSSERAQALRLLALQTHRSSALGNSF